MRPCLVAKVRRVMVNWAGRLRCGQVHQRKINDRALASGCCDPGPALLTDRSPAQMRYFIRRMYNSEQLEC